MKRNKMKKEDPSKLLIKNQLHHPLDRIANNGNKIFRQFFGHDIKMLSSFENFVNLMYQPTDAASIGVGRILFGMMMLIDIPEERSGGDLDFRWGEPRDCRFPLFESLKQLSLPKMGLVYGFMWLGALGITLGYKFKASCLTFVITYWYIFMLDKSSWNNHSYLYGLVSIIFLFTDAHHFCSIDAWRNKTISAKVPFWNYFLLKYQFFILYFIAGMKKISVEWLSGYSMNNLSYHWVFAPFRVILGAELTDLLIVHWFAAVFDLSIAFWLIYEKTRPLATITTVAFHLMNSRLFAIGMFPWVCLAELPLFYKHNWPRTLWNKLSNYKRDNERINLSDNKLNTIASTPKVSFKKRLTVTLIMFYCFVQLFLPYSHFITKGNNNWVNGIYGYSWDMMINAWDTILVSVKVVDHGNDKNHFMEPMAFTESTRWTQYPDMGYQYAKCIDQNLKLDFLKNPQTALVSDNYSIYFDIWCSLNGRFQQRIYNPTIDILTAKWHPLKEPTFTLPLLRQYTHFRKQMTEITKEVFSWSNYTDLMFIADFPGLTFDNYITPELDNVTLTVLEGAVRYQMLDDHLTSSLSKGQSVMVKSGVFHKVTTISDIPACYMYTYINATRQMLGLSLDEISSSFAQSHNNKPLLLSLTEEFFTRLDNYKRFIAHVANSILFEFYGVPMPRRLREYQD